MIRVGVSAPDLADLALAIRYENNGAVLRKDLVRSLRAAVRPAVDEAKSSIMDANLLSLHKMVGSDKTSLRAAIRKQVTTQVSLTTRSAKVKVRVRKAGMPRGFTNAPKAFNSPKGWRHPVVQRKLAKGAIGPMPAPEWVHQIGKPGWFDEPLKSRRAQYRAAVEAAVKATADRIARKV